MGRRIARRARDWMVRFNRGAPGNRLRLTEAQEGSLRSWWRLDLRRRALTYLAGSRCLDLNAWIPERCPKPIKGAQWFIKLQDGLPERMTLALSRFSPLRQRPTHP